MFRVLGGIFFFLQAFKFDIYLALPNYFKLILSIIVCIHVTQVLIIFIIRIIYSLHTLIYKKERFEVRNSPLNQYASILSKALYCFKFGCAATGAGATFIAGGMSYDSVLVQAGRPPKFLPFIGSVYTGVFGEVSRTIASNSPVLTGETPTLDNKTVESITDLVTKYENLTPSDKLDFLTEIHNKHQALERAKNNKN
jgi:hypothetical protein